MSARTRPETRRADVRGSFDQLQIRRHRDDHEMTFHGDSARLRNAPLHVSALASIFLGVGLVVCAGVEIIDGGGDVLVLLGVGLATMVVGAAGWYLTELPADVSRLSAFSAVAWTWIAASIIGAIPYLATGAVATFDDALFESASGFSCTGSTILSNIEGNGAGLLFWRQMTQWFGGMGMVVLAVAVLPFLGVGGLELVSAESPGEGADRLAPRVRSTALRLWAYYCGFTVVFAGILVSAGMSIYDGLSHSMATAATGGFSPYNGSVGHFDDPVIEVLIALGMLFCGTSFTLHWRALVRQDPRIYTNDSEFRVYALTLVALVAALVVLMTTADGLPFSTAVRDAFFNAATLLSSTGFGNVRDGGTNGNFVLWGGATQIVLLAVMFVGGSTGSTAGGSKILRAQVMVRAAIREIKRARRPHAVLLIKQGGSAVPEPTVQRIEGFVLIYLALIGLGAITLALLGTDTLTAITAAVSAMGNMGPGLGDVGPADNFLAIPRVGRLVLVFLMIAGRLEIFALLLMFASTASVLRRRLSLR